MSSLPDYEREHIRRTARTAAEAVRMAAGFIGIPLMFEHQAEIIAEVARTFAEGWLHVSQAVTREMWAIEDCRAHVRQQMRRELSEMVTSQGYIPVDLPAERLRYVDHWTPVLPGDDLDRVPDIPAEAVEQGVDWATVILALSVPVRRPPVDRAAAVRAGLLAGSTAAP